MFVDNRILWYANRWQSFWEVLESDVDPSFRYPLRLSLTISRPEGSASQEEQNRRSAVKIEENKMKDGGSRMGTKKWLLLDGASYMTVFVVTIR